MSRVFTIKSFHKFGRYIARRTIHIHSEITFCPSTDAVEQPRPFLATPLWRGHVTSDDPQVCRIRRRACFLPSAMAELCKRRPYFMTTPIERFSYAPGHLHLHRSRVFDNHFVSVHSFGKRNRGASLTLIIRSLQGARSHRREFRIALVCLSVFLWVLRRAASLTSSNGHMSDRRPTSLRSVLIQHPQRPRSFSSPAGLFDPVIPRGTRKPLSGRPPLRFGTSCAG